MFQSTYQLFKSWYNKISSFFAHKENNDYRPRYYDYYSYYSHSVPLVHTFKDLILALNSVHKYKVIAELKENISQAKRFMPTIREFKMVVDTIAKHDPREALRFSQALLGNPEYFNFVVTQPFNTGSIYGLKDNVLIFKYMLEHFPNTLPNLLSMCEGNPSYFKSLTHFSDSYTSLAAMIRKIDSSAAKDFENLYKKHYPWKQYFPRHEWNRAYRDNPFFRQRQFGFSPQSQSQQGQPGAGTNGGTYGTQRPFGSRTNYYQYNPFYTNATNNDFNSFKNHYYNHSRQFSGYGTHQQKSGFNQHNHNSGFGTHQQNSGFNQHNHNSGSGYHNDPFGSQSTYHGNTGSSNQEKSRFYGNARYHQEPSSSEPTVDLLTEHYRILGLATGATDEQINKAFRKLAIKYHPDKNQGDKKCEELFKKIAEAKDELLKANEQKKATRTGFGA